MVTTIPRYTISPAVRSSNDQDGTTLLHVAENKIYGLVGVGSSIWQQLVRSKDGLEASEIVSALATEFSQVSPERIRQDVRRLLDNFEDKHLVETTIKSPGFSTTLTSCVGDFTFLTLNWSIRPLLFLRIHVFAAVLAFAGVDLVLKFLGFNYLYVLVKRWPTAKQNNRPELTAEVWNEIARGITWYPRRVMCLQRSAVTTWLLRSRGIPAEMVVGCQQRPFLVHAWTEVDGIVVNDRQSVREVHQIIDRC